MTPNLLLAPSASFKKEATKALAAILGFMLVYLVLVAVSVLLVIGAFYAGIGIIMFKPGIYTLLAGIGIMAAGVMVFVFMVKFMFSSTKEDNSNSIEVSEEDLPQLFVAIYQVAAQTGTKRPKKVFLSPDVNACVFYNSSFWSMFLPIRKNLKIGLGLVNAVNASELKAVIAHEFGHFSQRSMKLGSWVYQVNKIIHDMLFNNKGYAEGLSTMNSIHGIVSIFVQITVGIVRAIQWVLRQMYVVVNKSYLGLSRQMEFHADLVASSVCGSNNMVNALHRVEFANDCYNITIGVCNNAWKQKKIVADFYSNHSTVLQHVAALNGFSATAGLPHIQKQGGAANRVNFRNQWASHPTLSERENYLKQFDLSSTVDDSPAWNFFNNAAGWKERLTQHLYDEVPKEQVAGVLDTKAFEELMQQQNQRYSFPELFGPWYDGREVKIFDPEAVASEPFTIVPFEQWFGEQQKSMPRHLELLNQDISVLDAISKKTIDSSSFDFDGKKYPRSRAVEVKAQLEGEKEKLEKELEAMDQKLFRHAYALAPLNEAQQLKEDYKAYFKLRKEGEEFLSVINNMMNVLAPVFRGETLQVTTISFMINELKSKREPLFKTALQHWEEKGVFDEDFHLKQKIGNFRSANWVYFFDQSFIESELIDLNQIVQGAWECVSNHIFLTFREVVKKQAVYLQSRLQHESKTQDVI